MLFHTWTFLVFMMVVLPVFFALGKTQLWVPWLLVCSYVFYGWWNPYYLILIAYSTTLDFALVALMDQCPRERQRADLVARLTRLQFDNRMLKVAFLVSTAVALALCGVSLAGPRTLRPALA